MNPESRLLTVPTASVETDYSGSIAPLNLLNSFYSHTSLPMIKGLTYDSEEIDEIYGILGVSLRDFADLPSDEAQDLINSKVKISLDV